MQNQPFILLGFLLFSQITSILTQLSQESYPESVNVTDFPSQNQTIYGGWIQSNETTGSLIYYNLFSKEGTDVASTDNSDTPIILYLEGGPSSSSVATAFQEIGPYLGLVNWTTMEPYMEVNPNSWTKNYHLLLIDQPVGTGFSVALNDDSVVSTDQGVDNLVTFLLRFFEVYPSTQDMDFYIYGRSYGAKFASVLAQKWLQNDRLEDVNLAGVILACGLVEPSKQFLHADAYYAFGVISQQQRDTLRKNESTLLQWIEDGEWSKVGEANQGLQYYLQNLTGGMFFYNFEKYVSKDLGVIPMDYLGLVSSQLFLANTTSPYRQSFQVPESLNFTQGSPEVMGPLAANGDLANSTAFAVEYLLDEGVDTLIFGAQLDSALPSMGIMEYVNELNWEGADDFKESERQFIYSNDSVIVSYQKSDNLILAIVNKAGHYTTYDQPQSVLTLLDSFINDKL